jgi:hypothetical protein
MAVLFDVRTVRPELVEGQRSPKRGFDKLSPTLRQAQGERTLGFGRLSLYR